MDKVIYCFCLTKCWRAGDAVRKEEKRREERRDKTGGLEWNRDSICSTESPGSVEIRQETEKFWPGQGCR
jgi:hypothetical protein